eukprot:764011-Hanusia_phi.AAC.3
MESNFFLFGGTVLKVCTRPPGSGHEEIRSEIWRSRTFSDSGKKTKKESEASELNERGARQSTKSDHYTPRPFPRATDKREDEEVEMDRVKLGEGASK